MYLIKIIAVVFIVFALTRVILRLKDRHITLGEFFFWVLIWTGGLVVIFAPGAINIFADTFGLESGIDVIVYLSIILLFYLLFRLYVRIENQEHNITKLAREITLKTAHKKEKEKRAEE